MTVEIVQGVGESRPSSPHKRALNFQNMPGAPIEALISVHPVPALPPSSATFAACPGCSPKLWTPSNLKSAQQTLLCSPYPSPASSTSGKSGSGGSPANPASPTSQSSSSTSRQNKGIINRCTNCRQPGHNRKTCPLPEVYKPPPSAPARPRARGCCALCGQPGHNRTSCGLKPSK
ncbi:hypothetical protein C8F01DRAFT_740593 [Mycena amicta]|nr:hypothetical protein C8F01DRAFT_740593 [Mycena amicta]